MQNIFRNFKNSFVVAGFLFLSAATTSCKKDMSSDLLEPSLLQGNNGNNGNHGNNGNGGNNNGGGTSCNTCYYSQGRWFSNNNHEWMDMNGSAAGSITVGGYHYTREEGRAYYHSTNGGTTDAKRAYALVASWMLSNYCGSYSGYPTGHNYTTDMNTVQNWLSTMGKLTTTHNPTTAMTTSAMQAYNRMNTWMESHECESTSSGSTCCYKSKGYWLSNNKHEWPDVNGSSAGSVTIGGYHYTREEARAYYQSSNSGGMTDAKKAYAMVATWMLSNYCGSYAGYATGYSYTTDMTTIQNWLSTMGRLTTTTNPTTSMTSSVMQAYDRMNAWMLSHECED